MPTPPLIVTEVRISPSHDDANPKMVCWASITLNGSFAIHNLRLIHAVPGAFVAMPNERRRDGRGWIDVAYPINHATRCMIETAVLSCYRRWSRDGEPAAMSYRFEDGRPMPFQITSRAGTTI